MFGRRACSVIVRLHLLSLSSNPDSNQFLPASLGVGSFPVRALHRLNRTIEALVISVSLTLDGSNWRVYWMLVRMHVLTISKMYFIMTVVMVNVYNFVCTEKLYM